MNKCYKTSKNAGEFMPNKFFFIFLSNAHNIVVKITNKLFRGIKHFNNKGCSADIFGKKNEKILLQYSNGPKCHIWMLTSSFKNDPHKTLWQQCCNLKYIQFVYIGYHIGPRWNNTGSFHTQGFGSRYVSPWTRQACMKNRCALLKSHSIFGFDF